MSLNILCSGSLVRYPVGGHSWHLLQYLVGFQRLGCRVSYFEDFGWENSCYDPDRNQMTSQPGYGIAYLQRLLRPHGLDGSWCYLAEDGAVHGMQRDALSALCSECDLYVNLDNINWIPELEMCRRRVTVDVDPVFTQIGAMGMGGPFARYDVRFTYAENIHRSGCSVPTGGTTWLPTRQPVVLDLWPERTGDSRAPFTSVINWRAYGSASYEGRTYGQKDREFKRFVTLPRETGETMELAAGAPEKVLARLADGGWRLADPVEVARTPESYQRYLDLSGAEFCVAKHAYVSTRSGWFSDRSAGYLALGRPVVVQDTGFSDFIPCGEGVLSFTTKREAVAALRDVRRRYAEHAAAARRMAQDYFDARLVLSSLLERSV